MSSNRNHAAITTNAPSDELLQVEQLLTELEQTLLDELATDSKQLIDRLRQQRSRIAQLQTVSNETSELSRAESDDPQSVEACDRDILSSVFHATSEGVAIIDGRGRIKKANSACAKIFQSNEDALIGLSVNSLLGWSEEATAKILLQVDSGNDYREIVTLKSSSGINSEDGSQTLRVEFIKPTSSHQTTDSFLIGMFSDITSIKQTQQKLFAQAMIDSVTSLPNRRYFAEQLENIVRQTPQQTDGELDRSRLKRLAICFIDLDEFKIVNDSMGHKAGDDLLRAVASRLKSNFGEDVFVARFGGDEFALLVPNLDPEYCRVKEPMMQFLESMKLPFSFLESEAFVGASIGITVFPDHSTDPDTLLRNADMAMYAAKACGKGTLRFYDESMHQKAQHDHRIQAQLRLALQNQELSLAYQPKFSVATRECVGCEALARWTTKDGQSISPGVFVPIAERTGLIVPLGEYVISETCRQIQRWQSEGFDPPRVAVNISPQHLRHPAFIHRVEAILKETNVRTDQLELEITENAVMEDVEHAIRIVNLLSSMNVTIAIDDFGTGYSSLSYLKDFNVQTLKIDRSFVKDLPDDQSSVAIIRSVVSLGKGRGLTIVAEGVETREQYDLLADAGCDVLQGFLLSRPVSAAECCEWFKRIDD